MLSKTALFRPFNRRRLLIAQSMLGVFLFWCALYLFVPTLPLYAQSKTSNLGLVGLALAQYGLFQAILRFPLGLTADWLGRRKPFILSGFVLAALGAWIMNTSGDIGGMAVGRAVTGMAASSWVVLVVAYSSLFDPAEATRAAASLTVANSLAIGLSSLAAGPLTSLGGYAAGFVAAMGAAGVGLLVFLPGKELRLPPRRPSLNATRQLVTRRDVFGPALLNALQQYVLFASIYSFTPILARQFGASDSQIGLLTTVNLAVTVVGNLLAAVLIRQFGERRLIYASFVLVAAGLGLTAAAPSLGWLFASQLLVGSACGLGFPTLMGMSITNVSEGQRSTAMGLHQAVYGVGMFAGPWLSGLLATPLGIQPMFAATAAAVLILGLLGTYLAGNKKINHGDTEGTEERI
jgi:MFS family permease